MARQQQHIDVILRNWQYEPGEVSVRLAVVPKGLVTGLSEKDLSGSFYELLAARYGIHIASGTQAIEPTVTNEEESAALGVPLHSPAFLFERASLDQHDRTVEFVHSVYRGDRYRIVTELHRPQG